MLRSIYHTVTFYLVLTIVSFNIFFWQTLNKSILFGTTIQSSWYQWLLFNPAEWSSNFFLPFIFSGLFHSSPKHLISNIMMLAFIFLLCEKKIGKIKSTLLFIIIHLLTLIFITLHFILSSQVTPVYFSGSSSATLGILGYYLIITNKWFITILFICLFSLNQFNIVKIFTLQEQLIDPHLLGFSIGVLIATIYNLGYVSNTKQIA